MGRPCRSVEFAAHSRSSLERRGTWPVTRRSVPAPVSSQAIGRPGVNKTKDDCYTGYGQAGDGTATDSETESMTVRRVVLVGGSAGSEVTRGEVEGGAGGRG